LPNPAYWQKKWSLSSPLASAAPAPDTRRTCAEDAGPVPQTGPPTHPLPTSLPNCRFALSLLPARLYTRLANARREGRRPVCIYSHARNWPVPWGGAVDTPVQALRVPQARSNKFITKSNYLIKLYIF